MISRSSNELTRYTFPLTTADNSLIKGGYNLFPSAFSGFYLTAITGANWLHYGGDLTLLSSMPTPPGDSYLFAISGDEERMFTRDTLQSGFFGSLRDLGF